MSTTIENQLQEINQIVAQGNLSTLNYTQGGPATGSRTSKRRNKKEISKEFDAALRRQTGLLVDGSSERCHHR